MKISQKLLVIVCLTVLEVSITVWATFQISKGASLHQLNSLHLKHNAHFSSLVSSAAAGDELDSDQLRGAVNAVLDQPIAAMELVGPVDRFVMKAIGTEVAIELILKDIEDCNRALADLDCYDRGLIDRSELVERLGLAAAVFNKNSSEFEGPVTRTVSFMLQMMIPMIIALSLFNICFISYLSRSISASIETLIGLLRSGRVDHDGRTSLGSHASGELRELMVVAEERLRAELMNIETNQELQDLIEERTVSLEAARNEAQASLAAKERFLANMSHELRTPINGILCASNLVLEDLADDDPHREFNSIIQDSAGSLLRLLNDILDVAKIESGKFTIERVPFDLANLVDQVAALMRPQAEDRGLSLRIDSRLEPQDRHLVGDPTRIRQVLVNFVSNAVKFTEDGEVRLSVEILERREDELVVSILVKDTGIGMTPEQLDGIFDRFVQADDSTTRRFGGTGLGMSLSREISRLMGGEIEVTSALEVGTRARLTIPLSCAEAARDAGSTAQQTKRDFAGSRVLLVEDNRVNQRVATKVLERLGIQVVVAENGEDALAKIAADIELVLMDIQMPVMDGLTGTRELIKRGWDQPIVALTANVFDEDREKYAEAGMVGFVAKPIQRPDLIAVLDRFLGSKGSEARAA